MRKSVLWPPDFHNGVARIVVRRQTKNRTGIPRIPNVPVHEAWVAFVCVKCRAFNLLQVGMNLPNPQDLYEDSAWACNHCGFVHSQETDLPFKKWPVAMTSARRVAARRFWLAFFRSAAERPSSFWKQCGTCGRVLPFEAFSRHARWSPLERQLECRACKGAINAGLNPKRTKEQLHEGSFRRRIADMLLKGENQRIDLKALFTRFNSRCFKTGKLLDIRRRGTWAVDHILPSKYLYPLTVTNAALLSRAANENKRDRWPSDFYTNSEQVRLAMITGSDLGVLSSPQPVVNKDVDVNACVERALRVREHSNLKKRIAELRRFLTVADLMDSLSPENKKLLGFGPGPQVKTT